MRCFLFYSHWVLYKLREQEDRLSLNLVLLAVSFRFLRCCCYMHIAQLNFFICKGLYDQWQRIQIQIKPKIALKISGHWVSLLSKENTQFLPQLKNTL